MNNMQPYEASDYDSRKVKAAKRAIVDVMQVLASYKDSIVLVGGWVPELLIKHAKEPHIGSIDVDLALNAKKLRDGKYADLLTLLLQTKRYKPGYHSFQLLLEVDLQDDEAPIEVEIDFLAEQDIKLDKNRPPLIENFRILQASGCNNAFKDPEQIVITGTMAKGAKNSVGISVARLPNFLIMKCFALQGRDKPKDAYDICFCLDNAPGGVDALATEWKARIGETDIQSAIEILRSKFLDTSSFGPQQVVAFYNAADSDERQQQANRAFFLVDDFLGKLSSTY